MYTLTQNSDGHGHGGTSGGCGLSSSMAASNNVSANPVAGSVVGGEETTQKRSPSGKSRGDGEQFGK